MDSLYLEDNPLRMWRSNSGDRRRLTSLVAESANLEEQYRASYVSVPALRRILEFFSGFLLVESIACGVHEDAG